LTLHVQQVQVRPAVLVQVQRCRIAAPALVVEADLGVDVCEAIVPEVAEQDARFVVLRFQVSGKGSVVGLVVATLLVVRGVDAHVAKQQIE
jgi:hypothetical protein